MIDKWIEHIVQVSMVVFPVSPYFNQYRKLKTTNQGFSLHVCGGLMLSNIFKIFFWYCKRFDVTILVQGIAMFAVQLWLLAVSKSTVHIKRRYPYTDVEVLGIFVYLYILSIQLIILILCQYEMGTEPVYIETIGFLGVVLEAAVPGFQVFRNFHNHSVRGFSEMVLLVWFIGDICKIGYHLYFHNPIQFVLCGIVQVTFDCILFYQFIKYSKGVYDFNKEPDEQQSLLNEDPQDYYHHSYEYSSSSQFEAKSSHQRLLAEGKLYENDYDEAVMDPKPQFSSKSYYDEPGNTSISSINSNKVNSKSKGKHLAIEIQEGEGYPSENERPSFHNSISSFRSYQYANIRNSNYYLYQQLQQQQQQPYNEIDSINSGHSTKNSHHNLNRKSSLTTFGSRNSSIHSSEPAPDYINLNEGINKNLNRSKSVQFPRNHIESSTNSNYDNHSYLANLKRSNSLLNTKK